MKKFILVLLIILGVGVISRVGAQMLDFNYRLSIPLGESHDFVSKMSFRGGSVDYQHFLTEHWSVGVSIGWNTYYKHLKYETGNFWMDNEKVTITGDQFRYLNIVPLLANVRYYFLSGEAAVMPYMGLGIGSNWAETRLEVGEWVAKQKGWQFAVAPEIGLTLPFSEHVGLNIAAQYQYSVKASGLPALQDLGIKIGLALNL